MEEYCISEFAIGNISFRNKFFNAHNFQLGENKTDCYKSPFLFNKNVEDYLNQNKFLSNYRGKQICEEILFDIDNQDDVENARQESIKFISYLNSVYDLPIKDISIYFSGHKGFHVVIPFRCFSDTPPEPREDFWKVYKAMALELSKDFKIDPSIYEPRRLLRLENTRHSESGLFKIPLSYDELNKLSVEKIKCFAQNPRTLERLPADEMLAIKELAKVYEKWKDHKFDSQPDFVLTNPGNDANLLISTKEGSRHSALVKIVSTYVRKGFTEATIFQSVSDWNKRNDPPLSDRELNNQTKSLFKRFKTSNDGIFFQFPLCLLSLPGKNKERLEKIVCYCVAELGADSRLIIDLKLDGLFEKYIKECSTHFEYFETYGKHIFVRVGKNFLLETLKGKNHYNIFAVYCAIVSKLGRVDKFPKAMRNSEIIYRSAGFKGKCDYQDYAESVQRVDLISDYWRRKSLSILCEKKNMLHSASLKAGRIRYYSTYCKTDSSILEYLQNREQKRNDKKRKFMSQSTNF